MKRRDFLQYASSSLVLPLVLDGFSAKAYQRATTPFMQALAETADANDRILVVIQLAGGNDGLNTVIPLDQYSTYAGASFRGNIALPETKILKLNGRPETGLHPVMTGMHTLFNEGKLSIVQAAGYPNPSFSHFRASDIWFTAVDSDKLSSSGWLGRYVDDRYPGYPDDYPNKDNPDPLAIQISSISSTVFNTASSNSALAIQDPDTFARIVGDKPNIAPGVLPDTPGGRYTNFVRQQQTSSVAYAGQLKTAAGKGKNMATYPTLNTLADQLKIVARLIHGGLQTKLYYVTLGGFDTHAQQVVATDTTTGGHAELLRDLSDGVKAFMDDLKMQGTQDRVVGMTFSEFGRRALSNASFGTDHGWASPLFVFGNGVKTQLIGKNPDLKDLEGNNIKMQNDFRQVYAAILTDWLGATSASVTKVLNNKSVEVLPIFRETITAIEPGVAVGLRLYPNPADRDLLVESPSLERSVQSIQVTDLSGRVFSVPRTRVAAQQIQLNVSSLPVGNYILSVETDREMLRGKIMVMR